MKIALASDLHNEFYKSEIPRLPKTDADILVLAGDIETVKSHDNDWWDETCADYEHVIYIFGNHEYYKSYYKQRPIFAYPNNVLVNRGLSAMTFMLGGYKWTIGTMWTDLSNPLDSMLAKDRMNDYRLIKHSRERWWFTPEDTTREFNAFIAEIEHEKPDIVVSHHLPSYGSVPERFRKDSLNAAYATELNPKGVKLWMHGHTHDPCDYEKDGCRIVCNPKGYPGERQGDYTVKVIDV